RNLMPNIRGSIIMRWFLFFCVVVATSLTGAAEEKLLWNLDELRKPPANIEWIDTEGPVRRLLYAGEEYRGKPTKVFAYCAFPEPTGQLAPGIVLIHGGGGTAFREWAELWRERGYVAIAMDLAGKGEERKPLDDGGPDQSDTEKFPRAPIPLTDMWSYHAVANSIRAHSLLRSLPDVDTERTAVTGISWGGYLTCIVAGLDDRFQAAVPVYGCGFLHENSVWLPRFESQLEPEWSKTWIKHFDPSSHVGSAKMPMLFVNGTNDFAYPLDSYQKTYRKVKNRSLCVTVRMPHSHPAGWAPNEIALFIDHHLRMTLSLPQLDLKATLSEDNSSARVKYRCEHVKSAEFHWTNDEGEWQKRNWHSMPAKLGPDELFLALPADRPLVGFFTLTDSRDATVSTEHFSLE
ncbi:MAG TPA: alpha/beta fold hydrolase, partial [Planctomycetaceae bacterium]|nr:alpha/beta fold hydrolase [Planctomycetaceae bacterium]